MKNKKLFKSAVIITASLFLFTGCGKKAEPVNAEPTETVSEVDTEESLESMESMESTEPAPSPTVETTEEPVEESSSNEESESDTSEEEEVEPTESESTGIEIVEELDQTMYAQTACNARSGDSTDYEKVTSMSKGESVHVTGRTSNDWYRVDWNNDIVYISSSLLGLEKPVVQQQSSGGSNSSDSGQSSGSSGGSSGDAGLNVGDVIGQTQNGVDVIYGGEVDTSDFY